MKCLTIIEPWASLISHGFKFIETRSWKTNYRGKLLIHASQTHQKSPEIDTLMAYLPSSLLPYGCLIAEAELVDCIYMTEEFIETIKKNKTEFLMGDYRPGRYAWILKNVKPIYPIYTKGKLGLWDYTPREKIAISACLIGYNCKYNGHNNLQKDLVKYLQKKYDLVPICPEVQGGLQIPRKASEIKNNEVWNICGENVTEAFTSGAYKSLTIIKEYSIKKAVLKSHSPSCGKGKIYDGTFSKKLIPGNGITANLLINNQIAVKTDTEILVASKK